MEKELWNPGNMLYPLPAVLVSCQGREGKPNIITVAWTGTICTNPALLYISLRPERYSYSLIEECGEFVVNLTTEALARATDYCGVRSGRDVDKFAELRLTEEPASQVKVPMILESPVNIECKVREIVPLGSHSMIVAEVLCVHADKEYMNEKGKFDLNLARPIVYSHGEYYAVGKKLGNFGYSVKKRGKKPGTKSAERSTMKTGARIGAKGNNRR